MGPFGETRGLLRFARGLPGFLVSPLAPGDAEPLIRRGMERRVDAFLEKVRESTTGGSRGPPRRIVIDLDHLAQMAPHWALRSGPKASWK